MWRWFFHPLWCRRHHRRVRIVIRAGNFAVELIPEEIVHMATTLHVGQTLPMSIEYLDQNGNPMLSAPPLLDAPPVWANNTPATETLTASADGHTASALAMAAGTDTVRLTLLVGGVQFSATLDVTVAAVVPIQTLTAIAIVPGTPIP
jgi:hypothetical protein